MNRWIPISQDALLNRAPPYDGKPYDVWFRSTYGSGHRETDVSWWNSRWFNDRSTPVVLVYGLRETHYMLVPTAPEFKG